MRRATRAHARGSETVRVERPAADWVGEAPPSGGFSLYLDVLRSRFWLIALVVAISVVTAAIFVTTADKVYKAEADLLVTAIPGTNTDLFGLGLVPQSGDPTRDVETFAQLVTTPAVADRVRASLGLNTTAQSLLSRVSAEPVAKSGIVAITAKAKTPDDAAELANAFGRATIADRTARFHARLDSAIPGLQRDLAELPRTATEERNALSAQIQALKRYREEQDPTLDLVTDAVPPAEASAPRPVLSIAAAFIAALVLGVGAVLGAHLLDTRITREEELRRYRIPILARVPLETRRSRFGQGERSKTPLALSVGTMDAFRRLGSSLAARTDGHRRQTIFITGAASGDGKTTTSINLAASFATMDERVILIEADSRQPSLARALGLKPSRGLTSVVTGHSGLAEALAQPDGVAPGVRVLCQEPRDLSAPIQLSAEAAQALIRDAERLADRVLLDGPALNYAPDALPLAKSADSVVLVIRLGKTRAGELTELAELLTHQGITPDGFVLVGGKRQIAYY